MKFTVHFSNSYYHDEKHTFRMSIEGDHVPPFSSFAMEGDGTLVLCNGLLVSKQASEVTILFCAHRVTFVFEQKDCLLVHYFSKGRVFQTTYCLALE